MSTNLTTLAPRLAGLLIVLLAGVTGVRAQSWNLVWSDEFDGPSIDHNQEKQRQLQHERYPLHQVAILRKTSPTGLQPAGGSRLTREPGFPYN